MVKRKIVRIDEELCNGCGKCVTPCAEGAIQIVNGKAKVLHEEFCDGLGYCIGICPTRALSIEERETAEFNEQAAKQHLVKPRPNASGLAAKCFKCGKTEKELPVFPVRFQGRSEWVCAHCIPQLIHG